MMHTFKRGRPTVVERVMSEEDTLQPRQCLQLQRLAVQEGITAVGVLITALLFSEVQRLKQWARRDRERCEAREGATAGNDGHQMRAVGHGKHASARGKVAVAGKRVVNIIALAGGETILANVNRLQLRHVGQSETSAVAANVVPTHNPA